VRGDRVLTAADDPSRVEQLVLGVREEDGTVTYAGTVAHFAQVDEVDRGLGLVKGLAPLLDRPAVPAGRAERGPGRPRGAVPVRFTERDPKGVLKNPVVQGIGRPKADEPGPDGRKDPKPGEKPGGP
jgi:hypothetical protein